MIKVLFLASRPQSRAALAVREEVEKIVFRLSQADNGSQVQVIHEFATMFADVPGLLRKHRPNIVHFSGHGTGDAELLFEDSLGQPMPVSKEALVALFATALARKHTRCVVLNACYSADVASEITAYIDFAIGSAAPITDVAAIAFAENFYQGLAYDESIQDAFETGRTQFLARAAKGASLPNLFVRQGADAQVPFTDSPPAKAYIAPPQSPMSPSDNPPTVSLASKPGMPLLFINYVPDDGDYCEELKNWLRTLRKQKPLEFWDFTNVCAGELREAAIQQHLEQANLVILLLSATAMANDEWDRITKRALELQKQGRTRVVPILLRHALLDGDTYHGRQILPLKKVPIASASERGAVWGEVVAGIAKLLP